VCRLKWKLGGELKRRATLADLDQCPTPAESVGGLLKLVPLDVMQHLVENLYLHVDTHEYLHQCVPSQP
jgi:hypothetical protein